LRFQFKTLITALAISLFAGTGGCAPQASPTPITQDHIALLDDFLAKLDAGAGPAAAETFARIRQRWPSTALYGLTPNGLLALDRELLAAPDVQFELERYVDSIDSHGVFDGAEMDGLWLRLAVKLWEAGDKAGAERVLLKISLPSALAAIRADRRFDAVVQAHPERFDVDKVLAQRVDRLRRDILSRKLTSNGPVAETLYDLGGELETQGDDAQARKAYEAALAVSETEWQREDGAINISRVALNTGRLEEATKIIDEQLMGERTQYGMLWRAEIGLANNLPLEAADSLSGMIDRHADRLSPVGRMIPLKLEVCVASLLGAQPMIDRVLKDMDLHAEYGPIETIDAHLCADDLDGAAAVAIRFLRLPHRRHAVLATLQDWAVPPYRPEWVKTLDDRRLRLRERPDVAAELQRVGRVQAYRSRLVGSVM
jgi:tetratricopeptide (TPR) repeat protein